MGVCLTLSPVQLHIPGKLVPLNHLSSPTRPSASYGHTVICTGLAYMALPDSSLPQTPLLFRKQTFSTPGHIYRTIQHLCSWKSLGLDASRVSLLVNCPPASRILQQPTLLQAKPPGWTFEPLLHNRRSLRAGLSFPPCSGIIISPLLQLRKWRLRERQVA